MNLKFQITIIVFLFDLLDFQINSHHIFTKLQVRIILLKFGYSEKATKFEKIFHLKFDVTE